jgi:hypothetical protein
MRRLAREAVIFILVGFVLTGVGSFIYLHHEAWKPLAAYDDSNISKTIAPEQSDPLAKFGTPAQMRPVWIYVDIAEEYGGWISSRPKVPAQITASLKTNEVCNPNERTLGDDGVLWICVRPDKPAGLKPGERWIPIDATSPVTLDMSRAVPLPNNYPATPNSNLAVTALFLSLYGFPGGFLAWVFYRIIYFAVKG